MHIENFTCTASGLEGGGATLKFCGQAGEDWIVLFTTFSTETFDDEWHVAIGKYPSALAELPITRTEGNPNAHKFYIEVEYERKPHVFLFPTVGQPEIFGEYVELIEDIPDKIVPEGAAPGYYGRIPSIKDHFLVYTPQEALDKESTPATGFTVEVLMGKRTKLAPIPVSDSYSFGWGSDVYVETEQGTFFFTRDKKKAVFGEIIHSYFVH